MKRIKGKINYQKTIDNMVKVLSSPEVVARMKESNKELEEFKEKIRGAKNYSVAELNEPMATYPPHLY